MMYSAVWTWCRCGVCVYVCMDVYMCVECVNVCMRVCGVCGGCVHVLLCVCQCMHVWMRTCV